MTVFQLLLVLFITVPLLEIYLLIQVGSVIGAPLTIVLVVVTAVIGASLVRSQGLSTLQRVQTTLAHNELPAGPLLEGALILLAGALLLTPGLVTDAIGFVCLIPPWRQALVAKFLGRPARQHPQDRRHGRVIEGEFSREDD